MLACFFTQSVFKISKIKIFTIFSGDKSGYHVMKLIGSSTSKKIQMHVFSNCISFLFRINISKLPDPAPVEDSMHCAHCCENGEALKIFFISTQFNLYTSFAHCSWNISHCIFKWLLYKNKLM